MSHPNFDGGRARPWWFDGLHVFDAPDEMCGFMPDGFTFERALPGYLASGASA